jgi:hypothetical protein
VTQRSLLAANEWDSVVPGTALPEPLHPGAVGAILAFVAACGGLHLGLRRWLLRVRLVPAFCGGGSHDDPDLPTG